VAMRIGQTARNVLAVWGAVCLLALAGAASMLAYSLTIGARPRDDQATARDVRFVLNWTELGDERIEAVVRSRESRVHINGDHFAAYAIRVRTLSEGELASNGQWVRGDRADALMAEAIRFVAMAGDQAPWLPTPDELLTDKYYVWRWRVEVMRDVNATLIFARPADRMIFYASLQV
jgi:hypothetical protein